MSVNYADALSPYPNKGKVGMQEYFDDDLKLQSEISQLANLLRESRHTVAVVGAGISTSAGIPDFRGPNGVWTLEKQGLKPQNVVADFCTAKPTSTHRVLVSLQNAGLLHFVISQNIDGLLHRAGFPLSRLAEVHGNVFMERCPMCKAVYIRQHSVVPTMTLKPTGRTCERLKTGPRSSKCRGMLRDTVLDWEDELPEPELSLSYLHAQSATLCLCLGTSLQIFPVAGLPKLSAKQNGKVAFVNLQKTRFDSLADVRIFAPLDTVMTRLAETLNIPIISEEDCSNTVNFTSESDKSSSLPLIQHDFFLNDQF